MFLLSIFLLIVSLLCTILGILGISLNKKNLNTREKMSPFECGFSPKFNARLPFTLRFFLLAIIFLVFDVELVLMFPFLMNLFSLDMTFLFSLVVLFIVILTLGLSHEWNQGSIDWSI